MSFLNAVLSLFKKPAPAPARKPLDIGHLAPPSRPSVEVDFEPIKYEPVLAPAFVQTHFIAANMKLSDAGARFIRQEEGCKLKAYKDTVGVWTIGVGHTGPDVYEGLVITQARADELLRLDAVKHCKPINDLVRVPLTQNEYDAMSSLAFNIGVGGFSRSSVLKRLNAGDRLGAAEAFMMWVKPVELTGRRRRERALFLTKPGAKNV